MTGRLVAACDLDRTLIYSLRSADAPAGYEQRLVCVEHYADRPQSFVSTIALAGIRALAEQVEFVPTTTRTRAQMERVQFPGVRVPRYQIAVNGGVLLVDGVPDDGWAATVDRVLADSGAPVDVVWRYLISHQDEPWLERAKLAEDRFCYALVDRDLLPADTLAGIDTWTADRGWVTSVQGRKLYIVPKALNKESAVAEVARRVGAGRVVAAGDSLLDRPMLMAADAGIRPGHGELAAQGWTAPHVTALTESGVVAGERIVDWLLAQAGLS